MHKKTLFIIFLFFSTSFPVDGQLQREAKNRVYSQLDRMKKSINQIIEELYFYIYTFDEWEASRFSTVGKLGQAIDRYFLFKDPNVAAKKLKRHGKECKQLVKFLAPILKDVTDHMYNMSRESEDCKSEIKNAVIFLGDSISAISGTSCEVYDDLQEQLNIYDIDLIYMSGKFKKNKLKGHIPRFMQVYREKFLVTIWGSIIGGATIFALGKSDWVKDQCSNVVNSCYGHMKTSMESGQILLGIKDDPTDETIKQITKAVENARISMVNVAKDEGLNIHRDISSYDLMMEIGEERVKRSSLGDNGRAVGSFYKSKQELNNALDDVNLKLKDLGVKFNASEGFWSLAGWESKNNHKLMQELGDSFSQLLLKFMGHTKELSGFYSLEAGRMLLIYNNMVEGVLPSYYNMSKLSSWGYAVIPPIIFYSFLKRGIKYCMIDYYLILDNCILEIDYILSRYVSNSKTMSKEDEGCLIYWLDKVRKIANAISISRDDRMRIASLIEQIKNPELPVSQKLRALDIQWRFRKSVK